MVRRYITVTLLTRVLGGCSLPWKVEYDGGGIVCALRAFYAEVRSNDKQNWLRFLNSCNKGKLTFSCVDEVVYTMNR